MGIPMYHEPSSMEATKNNSVKDPCAAARSTIRRQATVRRSSRNGGSAWRSTTLRSPFPRPIIDEIEREASGPPRHSHSPASIPAHSSDPFDLNSSLADTNRRLRMIDDALRHRPGHRLRLPRTSTLSDLNTRSAAVGDANARLETQDRLPLTPRFAPAIAYHRSSTPLAGSDLLRRSPMPRHDGFEEETPAGSFVPLSRQAGQRSINDTSLTSRGPPIDGLGDRQRSVDLDDDHANDAWETLLTTITPDTNLPSADSSFTSTSASGSSNSHNDILRSSATSLESVLNPLPPTVHTVQMTLDPHQESTIPCDYPSSTDSGTESDGEITQQSLFRRYRRRMREVESLRRSQNRQSLFNNASSIPTISLAFTDSPADQDLQNMQAILDRLARREYIPDGWWAAAGLSRTLDQRAGAGDELDSTPGPEVLTRNR